MNPNKKHGFVLIPDDLTIKEAIRLNSKLPEGKLKLSRDAAMPHITLLQTFFAESFDYEAALQEVSSYEGFIREPRTVLETITVEETQFHSHIVWWNVENSGWLKELNKQLIERHSSSLISPSDTDTRIFRSKAEEESYRLTGYERNLGNYEPHITVAVLDTEPEHLPTPQPIAKRARMRQVAFVEHGTNGTIARILESVALPMTWD